jgi:subtilisin family serine protease
VGAVGNNGIGITGVAQSVSLIPYQVTTQGEGLPSALIAQAVNRATDAGVQVLSCSADLATNNSAIFNAVRNYPGLFVYSAGNNGTDNDSRMSSATPIFSLPNAIMVGGLHQQT